MIFTSVSSDKSNIENLYSFFPISRIVCELPYRLLILETNLVFGRMMLHPITADLTRSDSIHIFSKLAIYLKVFKIKITFFFFGLSYSFN